MSPVVAYSFQQRFIKPIREGIKQQTIRAFRADPRRHAHEGDELQLYYGMRTRHCMLIGKYLCTGQSPVTLTFNFDPTKDRPLVAGAPALPLDVFARCDGFADWAELRAFWREKYPGIVHFEGVIIFWVPL